MTESRLTQPGWLHSAALIYKTKPSGHGLRADDSPPNPWKQTAKGPPVAAPAQEASTRNSDQPTVQMMKFKNRTFCGSWEIAG